MLSYKYKARDTASNKIVSSTIQASSESAAARLLMAQHIVPLEIKPVDQSGYFYTSAFDYAERWLAVSTVTNNCAGAD